VDLYSASSWSHL